MNNKALIIGIDKYKDCELHSCEKDANDISNLLQENYDGTKNFDVKTLLNEQATRANIRRNLRELFKHNCDIALFYFSGHGYDDENDGFIVSSDFAIDDYGISMPEIIKFVNKSKAKNKIVILDCCYSGFAGSTGIIGDESLLSEGTIILSASRKDETAAGGRYGQNSVFTGLFIEALDGAASDIFGNTSLSSIYAFIDRALGTWEQRPIFKSNVDSFISLRKNKPSISNKEIKQITNLFSEKNEVLKLDPSYEPTNYDGSRDRHHEPYFIEENGKKFEILQLYNKNGLVVTIEEKNLYETAMNSKNCKLTKLGMYYYDLVKSKKI